MELGKDMVFAAERELCVDRVRAHPAALTLEPSDALLGELFVAEVGERRATPQPERLREQPVGRLRIAVGQLLAAAPCDGLETIAVELARLDLEHVAAGRCREPVSAEPPAQPRHVLLD